MNERLYTVSHSPPVTESDIKRGIWVEEIGFQSVPKEACSYTNSSETEHSNINGVHSFVYIAQGKGEFT